MGDWKLAYHANCWGPLGGSAEGVTSITQLSYQTFGDMDRAFADIAGAGYAGVELFDGNLLERSAAELGKALADNGLSLVAAYSGANFIFDEVLPEELARVARAADRAAELGAPHLVVGGGAKRFDGIRETDYHKLAAALDRVKALADDRGLTAHYHPHLSTIVEGPEEVHKIFGLTEIDFCPDTAHLAAAGSDPARLVRELSDRISYIHLKGLQREPFMFTPLDEGDVPSGPILDAIRDTDFSGWICVELDAWEDPAEGARRSRKALEPALAN
ncbi:sugar phosphate isomerase/epimerase family protein [Histidinibacterium aquaticum]|uniref:Sugar phosphate isomerase/epimerase n=1 Tax=Histidinibacterium aquaticum TaxID=2613962 RepID=A0A5J5GR35_9RHOB|nr:sugar phosphate isomerase/epimerase [Histidinibacterium aquaticum]KAA9010018.1 sugar phosphate isomerase/epimerase [Histidinibacterium aquaticum]